MQSRFTSRLLIAGLAFSFALGACSDPAPTKDGAPDPKGQDPATEQPGTPDTAAVNVMEAYDRGLDFLASQQEGGIWKTQGYPDPGSSALALSVFLERPGGAREQDKEIISKGLAFISSSLGDDGGVRQAPSPNYMTSAAISALAASGDPAYKGKIERAAKYIEKLQFLEDGPSQGGIGYGSDKTRSDMSNTQFALGSLRAAGISADDPVFQKALQFVSRSQNRKENEAAGAPTEWKDEKGNVVVHGNDGGANYRPFDSKAGTDKLPDGKLVTRSYGSMTYALLRCYHLCGLEATDGRVQAAVDWISGNWDLEANAGMAGEHSTDGLYYYYMTMAKALDVAGIDTIEREGAATVNWRAELSQKLAQLQKQDGSWVNPNERWNEGYPVIVTSYSLLALSKCDG